MNKHKFPYDWKIANGFPAKGIEYHGKTVFGCFVCGGGSSFGYKLAGFKHLGGVEIDAKIAKCYKENHGPQYLFVEDIRDFNKRKDLPKELYNLDILDGSPPCSSFSMSGNREKDWGKEKVFSEGQELQRLDDLVFEYIKTIEKLKPKAAILENVKGLIQGNAKAYAKEIKLRFEKAGYRVQLFLLNAATMGVPQRRERVFFVGLRNDYDLMPLNLNFNEKPILFSEVEDLSDTTESTKSTEKEKLYPKAKQGESFSKSHPKGNYFNSYKISKGEVCPTVIAHLDSFIWHYKTLAKDGRCHCATGSLR